MKKNKIFNFLIVIVFISFLCSYIVCYSGYYEYNLSRKTTIMNEKIKEFENAVKDNKELDTIDFFKEEKYNYTNRFSNIMYDISNKGNDIFRKILRGFFNKLSKYMLDD